MAKRVGRKSKYESNVKCKFTEIREWRIEGYTESQIANLCGVAYSTFMVYINKYPELKEVLKQTKAILKSELKQSLFQEAMGTRNKVETYDIVYELDRRTNTMIAVKRTDKYSNKRNITSLIFALKNIDPDNWQDRRDVNVNTNDSVDKALDNFKLVSDELKKNIPEADSND